MDEMNNNEWFEVFNVKHKRNPMGTSPLKTKENIDRLIAYVEELREENIGLAYDNIKALCRLKVENAKLKKELEKAGVISHDAGR